MIKFTDKMVANLISKIGQHTFDKLFAEMVLHFEEASQKKLLCIFDEMEQEWAHYNSYSELLLEGLLNKLIITAMQERLPCSKHEFVLSGQHQALIDAVRYVDRHFMENPSLEDTARAVNVSASYLSKLFTQNITSTYSQFLTREKINHASKLLSHTNLSITEISGQSGFQNSNYFSDAFKKVTGKSPLKFRKQLHSE